jgi:transcriptional regulator with XRE-family HTH domain
MASKKINQELNKAIGTKVKSVRSRANGLQYTICEHIGLSMTAYSKLENGKVDFTVSRLQQIADFYEVKLSDFLDEYIDVPRLVKDVKSPVEYQVVKGQLELMRELYDAEKQQNQKKTEDGQ